MSAPSFQHVAIVGVGLIGGSIARALRERGLAGRVTGVGSSPERAEWLGSLGVVDEATHDLAAGVAGADLVVVCTPVRLIADAVVAAGAAAPAALLTDAGSTKAGVVRDAERRLDDPGRFVGAHPLAGDHRTGPEAAQADLFANAKTILTPTDVTEGSALERARGFWDSLGAETFEMTPERHDELLAASSHLPHVAAAAVAACTGDEALPFTATGWADTTRVAAGSPTLWRDILLANREAVDAQLARLSDQISAYRGALATESGEELEALLEAGRRRRDAVGD